MDFQGFQHSFPYLVVAGVAVVALALSFFTYRKQETIALPFRLFLMSLRALSFILLLILLLNPFFFKSEEVIKKPRLLVFLDNTESVSLQKGSYNGIESYNQVLEVLNFEENSGISVDLFSLGSSPRPLLSTDSLTFNENETNFINGITQIQELENDYEAAIIVSDGIITFGRNPVLQASELSIPLFTIAVGDTSTVRDITFNNVQTNPTAYTDTQHLVEVEVKQNGFAGERTTVLIENQQGYRLSEEIIQFSGSEEVRTVRFQLPIFEPGLKQFFVRIDSLDGEWSTENNRTAFSIDVVDSKTRILHASFEIHPDVKMVRSILSEDPNIELSTLTWIGGNRFIEPFPESTENFDQIIIHGKPPTATIFPLFEELIQSPTVYFQLPESRKNLRVFPEISILENSGNQVFELDIVPKVADTDHPIMELPEIGYATLAPIKSTLRTMLTEVDATVLFNSAFQDVETPNPIIAVLERGGLRRVEVAAWSWFTMYQSSNEAERNFITQLISNMTVWAANDPDDRRLKVTPSKSVFNISEPIIINANLNNESGEVESDAAIDLVITKNDAEGRSFTMQNEGNGTYKLTVNSLAPGMYTYSATARKGDRVIDEQTGEFLVEDSNNELINTIRNDDLLYSLANETGGKFYDYQNANGFWSDLDQRNLLQNSTETIESYVFPVRSAFWFMLLLILLGTEWVLRKYFSLP
jgi:hypothetical protein